MDQNYHYTLLSMVFTTGYLYVARHRIAVSWEVSTRFNLATTDTC